MKKRAKRTIRTKRMKRETLNKLDFFHCEGKFGKFEVRKTANGWWGSQNGGAAKLINFLSGIKMDFSIRQACAHAGLTEKQWEHFAKSHPEFCDLLPLLAESVNIAAQVNVARSIEGSEKDGVKPSIDDSRWWLERRNKGKFSTRSELTGPDGKPLDEISDEHAEKVAKAFLKAQELKANEPEGK